MLQLTDPTGCCSLQGLCGARACKHRAGGHRAGGHRPRGWRDPGASSWGRPSGACRSRSRRHTR